MRLVAVYFPKGVLPHLFGEDHEAFVINFGGNYNYSGSLEIDTLTFNRQVNSQFIENFYGNNIALVSAIVGANGSGKTSILRKLLREELVPRPANRNCVFIYEKEEIAYLLNETGCNISVDGSFVLVKKENYETIVNEKLLYYSPNLDYDLQDINSPISLVSYHKNNLSLYNLNGIRRHLFFLKNKSLIDLLRENYYDFPFYEKLEFKAKLLYKSDFEKVYIQATLGNKLYRIRNRLLDEVRQNEQLENGSSINLTKEDIEEIFDRNETIQDQLKALWKTYKNKDRTQYVNENINFLKDVEVNMLSYLVIHDTFSLNGDYGSYDFDKILKADSFIEKLTHYFNKYFIQSSKTFYGIIKSKLDITLDNLDSIANEVKKLGESNSSFAGVTFKDKAKVLIRKINIFKSIKEFYFQLIELYKENEKSQVEGGFFIDLSITSFKKIDSFFDSYEKLISHLKFDDLDSILEIKSEKKLSTGEKSLIDLFSSLYDYLKRYDKPHMYSENYILLLDEPEQGYHPLWKKKLVLALSSSLQPLFSVNKKVKSIQVIFTTHDPLTLSDIPQSNIVYLNKNEEGQTFIATNNVQSFGANVHDLLANSFFLKGGFMGEFAKGKIQEVLDNLNFIILRLEILELNRHGDKHNKDLLKSKVEQYKNLEGNFVSREKPYLKSVIDIIDEPILRFKMKEMFFQAFPEYIDKDEAIKRVKRILGNAGLNIDDLNEESL
tara:strand:+ start:12096 stop:14258 length:2163 start_codon:yes stop_codon:yes gene_type:complete